MKNCPHCGQSLGDESKTEPVRKQHFVSHYRRICHSSAREISDEMVPFTEFHAVQARTELLEQGLPIEKAKWLIDVWNRLGNLGDRQYIYSLI